VIQLTHDQHIDWPTVLADLRSAGMDWQAIAKRIGAEPDRIRKWSDIYCQPRHDDGVRLLSLWCSKMQRQEGAAPVVSRYA
jgi:hypothetical protein